jgi:hypothetical protein
MITYLKNAIGFNPLRWLTNAQRFKELIKEFVLSDNHVKKGSPHCGIVITPWLGTSVPWFSIGIGLLLARHGNRVTFLFDNQQFGNKPWRYRFVLTCLKSVLDRLRNRYDVVTLDQVNKSATITIQMREDAKFLANLNAVWHMRGEMVQQGRREFEALCERQLVSSYPAIHKLVQPGSFDLLFVPGGVWGTSGVWARCAAAAGIRMGTFDSGGYGTTMLAVNGVACQMQDIPEAFALVKGADNVEGALAFAVEEAQAEMARRQAGVDSFMSQVQGGHRGDSRYDGAVLLALNSSWDSAALGLHTIFKNNGDWIVSTVRYLLDETDVTVIVRQHPAERLDVGRTTDDYQSLLIQHFGIHPRLHFIAAADKINSYKLMARVRALVVYTSTIGIEACANGKPVITPSNSYYSGLGFVHKATTLNEYQELLKQAANGELKVEQEQLCDALLCYYLTQCCNWVFSPFNPADFNEWIKCTLEEWYVNVTVNRMLLALTDNIPIAYLNHIEKYRGRCRANSFN